MRNILGILGFALLIISCSNRPDTRDRFENLPFSDKEQEKHLLNREDSTTWDLKKFNNDLQYVDDEPLGPFKFGVFPVPHYDLVGTGSFTGVGNFAYTGASKYYKKIGSKMLLFNSFKVKKSTLNSEYLGNRKDEIFFHIVVLTDNIDTINYSHVGSEVISRNHPDYIGQGFYKTKNNRIDYTAFITANRNSYAIVNTRLFDLKFGKTILIAPQKDKSLRSMQIKSPFLSSNEIDEYTDGLLEEQEIIDFFSRKGNI